MKGHKHGWLLRLPAAMSPFHPYLVSVKRSFVKARSTIALMVALLVILLTVTVPAVFTAAPSQPQGWVTVLAEDFEGEFPHSPWHIGRTGDPYLWGQRNCNPHSGNYSMWGGGGGVLGSQIPCSGTYTTGYVTTLSYGPLDLSTCSDLKLTFANWIWLAPGDALGVGYSIDGGTSWRLLYTGGNRVDACGGWCVDSLTQNQWSVPICGHSKVYLLFRFNSDASQVSYGAFVDDVVLEAFYEGMTGTLTATPSLTPTHTRTPSPTPTASVTPSRTPTPTPTAVTANGTRRAYLPLLLRQQR